MGAEMIKYMKLMALVFVLVAFPQIDGSADESIGVILMHGKGVTARPTSPIGQLAETLESAGFIVIAPDMPWHGSRIWGRCHVVKLQSREFLGSTSAQAAAVAVRHTLIAWLRNRRNVLREIRWRWTLNVL